MSLERVFWFLLTISLLGDTGASKAAQGEQREDGQSGQSIRGGWLPLFDGKSLGKWKIADKHFFEDHGEVHVKDGAIHLGKGKPATGIRRTDKFPRSNYEIILRAQRTSGDDFFCGLTVPIGNSYVTLIVGGWGGGLIGLSNMDGESAADNITTDHFDFENGKWYQIRLRVSDDRIQAWIDKEQVVDQERAGHTFSIWWEQEPVRPLGIATWDTASVIREIYFRSIEPSGTR